MRRAFAIPLVVFFAAAVCICWLSAQAQGPGAAAQRGKPLNPTTTVIIDYVDSQPNHKGQEHGRPKPPGGDGPDHSAGHFELIGGTWADRDSSSPEVDPLLTFFVDLRGFPEGSEAAIGNAFLAWEDATKGTLIDELVGGDVLVLFGDGVNTFSMRNLGGGGVLAATFITWDDANNNGGVDVGEEFLEMDIVHNSIVKWAIAETNPKGKWWDVPDVATHEIGHAFGMDHPGSSHTEDLRQTMFASAPTKETSKRTLEADGDIPGIQSAFLGYGAPSP